MLLKSGHVLITTNIFFKSIDFVNEHHVTDLIRIRDRQFLEKLSVDKNHPLKDLLYPAKEMRA